MAEQAGDIAHIVTYNPHPTTLWALKTSLTVHMYRRTSPLDEAEGGRGHQILVVVLVVPLLHYDDILAVVQPCSVAAHVKWRCA